MSDDSVITSEQQDIVDFLEVVVARMRVSGLKVVNFGDKTQEKQIEHCAIHLRGASYKNELLGTTNDAFCTAIAKVISYGSERLPEEVRRQKGSSPCEQIENLLAQIKADKPEEAISD